MLQLNAVRQVSTRKVPFWRCHSAIK